VTQGFDAALDVKMAGGLLVSEPPNDAAHLEAW